MKVEKLKRASAILTLCFFACHFLAIKPHIADVDRSGAVDLGDAILAVRGLQYLSESVPVEDTVTSKALAVYLHSAVEAFKILAGVKSFTSAKPPKTLSPGASILALLPAPRPVQILPVTLIPEANDLIYKSIEIEPTTRPPKHSWLLAA